MGRVCTVREGTETGVAHPDFVCIQPGICCLSICVNLSSLCYVEDIEPLKFTLLNRGVGSNLNASGVWVRMLDDPCNFEYRKISGGVLEDLDFSYF